VLLCQLEAGIEVAPVDADGRSKYVGWAGPRRLLARREPPTRRREARIEQHLRGDGFKGDTCIFDATGDQQCPQEVVARAVVARADSNCLLQLLDRAGGIAAGQQRLCLLDINGRGHCFGARHVPVEKRANLGLGQGADKAVHRLSALEQHAERNAAYAEHLRELARDVGLLVRVELG
jgi:hypothetical protein